MTEQVKGFALMVLISENCRDIALLTKNRPSFLADKDCPPGGTQEEGESTRQTASREFDEETTVQISPEDWLHFATVRRPGVKMDCFVAFSDAVYDCKTPQKDVNGEQVEPVKVRPLATVLGDAVLNPQKYCPDFIAIIGLALHAGKHSSFAELAYN